MKLSISLILHGMHFLGRHYTVTQINKPTENILQAVESGEYLHSLFKC